MSDAHTWFGSVIDTPRSKILLPGAVLLVPGRGTRPSSPIRRISRCTRLRLTPRLFLVEVERHSARAVEWFLQIKLVDPPQSESDPRQRSRVAGDRPPSAPRSAARIAAEPTDPTPVRSTF